MIPRRLLPNRVSITGEGGHDQFGPIPGTEIEVPALVEEKNRVIKDREGQEVVSSTRVYMDPREIALGTQVTVWPDDPGRKTLVVEQVHQYRAPGKSHTVIDLV